MAGKKGAAKPRVTKLAGNWKVLESGGGSGVIETAHRIEYLDGRVAFTLEVDEDGDHWEARLESRGRVFRGVMKSEDWEDEYRLEMELWVAPAGDEWLLLGTWQAPDEDAVDWAITLFPDGA